jgi:hypothetical protein
MKQYLNFLLGYRKFIKERKTLEQSVHNALNTIKNRLNNREETFLRLIKASVFENQSSPYLTLFRLANYSYKDVESLFLKNGLESALSQLREDGIYLTIEEFKGKREIIRNGETFKFREKDFDNPFLRSTYEAQSGGTRSAGTRVRVDFDFLAQKSLYHALMFEMHGLKNSPLAIWLPLYPSGPGLNSVLRFTSIGKTPDKWFTHIEKGNFKISWNKRLGTNYVIKMGKFFGAGIPKPEFVALNEAGKVAKWINRTLQEHESICLYTFASSAVRICYAAEEMNLRIGGAKFFVTGEPLSPKKRQIIESTGCNAIPVFGVTEGGSIGYGCNIPYKCDAVHSFKDTMGVIQHKRSVLDSDVTVDAFLFTSLLPSTPKIFINVESGDFGVIEQKDCGCLFGQLGLSDHIYNIRSFEKLTGEGVTFVDTDIVNIVEVVFPQKFGGTITDYQIVEREYDDGITRLEILVSPALGPVDESKVISTFLSEIRNGNCKFTADTWSQTGTQMWEQADSIVVLRTNPILTKRGKILPFHIVS